MGCALVYTEMISGMALVYRNRRTLDMLHVSEDEHPPIAIQLFGSDPRVMASAARIVMDAGADVIDINMGCPVPKIVNNGEGSALMRDPERAWAIVAAVRQAVDVPVTVKIRKGWDDSSVNAVEFAKGCVDAGGADGGVAVHGRTREQGYSGDADWNIIAQVAHAVDVPVIGNGGRNQRREFFRNAGEHGGCAGGYDRPWGHWVTLGSSEIVCIIWLQARIFLSLSPPAIGFLWHYAISMTLSISRGKR